MSPPFNERRRRAAYRATHRGTKEMDWLLGRYAEVHLAAMTEEELGEFERFIALPDPDLQSWLMTGDGYRAGEFKGLIARIRAFHGLEPGGAAQ